jgi:Ca2+/Na+ antiporter
VGSAISNILGAFSLGLLFSGTAGDNLSFDASSRRYTVLQLAITILAAVSLGLREHLHLRVIGIVLIVIFVLYVGSIFWAIRKGLVTGPELSESDDESESASESDEEIDHRSNSAGTTSAYGTFNGESNPSVHNPSSSAEAHPLTGDNTRLFPHITHHSPTYHLFHLLVGFLSLLISAYVLTHAATTFVDQLGLSDEVFGLVILSIATTLPEKLVTSLSGLRGQTGIMVANTVGSSIFLLTLCLGIVWVSPHNDDSHAAIGAIELITLVTSSAAMCVVVFTRGAVAKGLGMALLVAYFAFLSLEITFMRHD